VIINDDGRVRGVRVQTPAGKSPRGDARRSSSAPAAFTHNEDMRRYYLGGRVVGGCAAFTNEGDFHRIAQRLGIPLVHMDAAYLAPLVLEKMVNRDPEMTGVFAVPADSLHHRQQIRPTHRQREGPPQDRATQMLSWDPTTPTPNFLMFAIWDSGPQSGFPANRLGGFIPGPDATRRT